MRLAQLALTDGSRAVAAATTTDGAHLVPGVASVRELAMRALAAGTDLPGTVDALGPGAPVDLAAELAAGRVLAPIDHPDPAHIWLTGTGLTHLGSAEGRDAMHRMAAAEGAPTDSMRMFLEGVAGGRPEPGTVGAQPEWFYKGDGSCIVPPGAPLTSPSFARDGGEEPELAGIYMIAADGTPVRLGFCLANEFSDHVTERHNYLWLAHSKLRPAALGPELLTGSLPHDIHGTSRIRRGGAVLWERAFLTGEANMSHSIANLEEHHFKYSLFRRPGDIHVHFFGTATLSYADGIVTQPGDRFEIEAAPFTLPLVNELAMAIEKPVRIRSL